MRWSIHNKHTVQLKAYTIVHFQYHSYVILTRFWRERFIFTGAGVTADYTNRQIRRFTRHFTSKISNGSIGINAINRLNKPVDRLNKPADRI